MDFKVAGDEVGVTAFQLDIKCEGLSIPLMRTALLQAREARLHILKTMTAASPTPAETLPPSVPRMFKTTIDPDKVGRVIGRGGETINAIIAETGVANIALDKPKKGDVTITAFTDEAIAAAKARIEEICGGDGGGRGGGGARARQRARSRADLAREGRGRRARRGGGRRARGVRRGSNPHPNPAP